MDPYEIALRKRGWVVTDGGCWEYLGTRHSADNYKEVRVEGRNVLAHRTAYIAWVGKDLGDAHVLHSCDNPPCINPEHLRKGTNLDNIADKMSKGRHRVVVGSAHHRARINETQALEIWELAGKGSTAREVGDRFGLSKESVQDIWAGRTWRAVTGA